jgi:hypothetical protein
MDWPKLTQDNLRNKYIEFWLEKQKGRNTRTKHPCQGSPEKNIREIGCDVWRAFKCLWIRFMVGYGRTLY